MSRPKKVVKPEKGDLVLVMWLDITGAPTGELTQATLTLSATPGFYVGYSGRGKNRKLVVAPTRHIRPEWDGTTGWDAYPAHNITKVHVLMPYAAVKELCNAEESG